MLTILWAGSDPITFKDDEKEKANKMWVQLLSENAPGLLAVRADGSVMRAKNNRITAGEIIPTIVARNVLKPSAYIKLAYCCFAKEWLPEEEPTYKTLDGVLRKYNPEHATEKQVNCLNRNGIFWTKGLTKKQAMKLISSIIDRDKEGLAPPWLMQAVVNSKHKKRVNLLDESPYVRDLTRKEALEIIRGTENE